MANTELENELKNDAVNAAEESAAEAADHDEMIQEGVHNYSSADEYVWPTDPKVLKKLEWFQDQKLALMMHWGAYSQLGMVESWALSDADAEWSRGGVDWEASNKEFKQQYFDLNKTFNPIRFEPEKWADIAKEAGVKYLIFTTKHHDGFCMWDSKYSDYKVTAPDCPFHTHKYADIAGHLFESFRKGESALRLISPRRTGMWTATGRRAIREAIICGEALPMIRQSIRKSGKNS